MERPSTTTRHRVLLLHQQDLSQAEISKTSFSTYVVRALQQKHKETGTVENQKYLGQPRKLQAYSWRMSSCTISSDWAETSGTLLHSTTVH